MDSPAQNNQNPSSSLSPEDIKKLTDQLSSEMDQEIKKQFANDNGLDTQQQVNAVLREQAATPAQSEITPPPKETPTTTPQPEPPKAQPDLAPPNREAPIENFDPLTASVNSALKDLKEGEQIDGWTLKKIYSTSFGSNKSSFYELENTSGAKWTLNPEEMKDLLKKRITSPQKEPVNLAPAPGREKPPALEEQTLAGTPGQKPIKKMIEEAIGKIKKEEKAKEIVEQSPSPNPEPITPTKDSNTASLTKEQIDFLSKLHSDKKQWSTFTGLKPEQVNQINELYEKGQLGELGIDAHPLTDKLDSENFGKEVLVKKGDTITTILSSANFQLSFQPSDSLVLGIHLLANQKIIKETLEKVAASGISTPSPLTQQETIDLIKKGLAGDNSSYQKLITVLTFLPVESKLRIFEPQEVESLRKYF